ncbi:MAG: TolC family protein [Deltaproteobacteria bacterium]|nr:TolC family protein [Deltaproteobacteria bacterium]
MSTGRGTFAPIEAKLRFLLTFTLALATAEGQADELSIGAAVEAARKRAPAILAARHRVSAAEARRDQASLFFRRNPELEGDWLDDRLLTDEGERRFSAAITVELELAGQPGLRGDVAERELQAAGHGVSAFERIYVGRVMEAFYALLEAQREAEVVVEILRLNEDIRAAGQRRLDEGDLPEVAHNLLVVEVERARADTELANAALTRARAELNRLLGRSATTALRAAGRLPDRATQGDSGSDEPERLDVWAARAEAGARGAEVDLLQREAIPNLRLSFGWELERANLHREGAAGLGPEVFDADQYFGIKLALSIPLFNRNQGAIREAVAKRAAAELEVIALEHTVSAEVASAQADLGAAARRLDLYAAALPRVDRNLELLARAFEAGQIDAPGLLAARDRSFRTRLDHLEAQKSYVFAQVALARALGRDPASLLEDH